MTEKSKALVKRSTALIKFNPKVRKELVIRGLTALDQVRDADFYFFKGKEHVIRGEYDDAIENCEKAIELNPKDSFYYQSLGHAQDKLNLYDDAIENYKKAIELKPEVVSYASLSKLECYRHIALCYKKMGLEHLELEYWEKRDSLRESRRGNG